MESRIRDTFLYPDFLINVVNLLCIVGHPVLSGVIEGLSFDSRPLLVLSKPTVFSALLSQPFLKIFSTRDCSFFESKVTVGSDGSGDGQATWHCKSGRDFSIVRNVNSHVDLFFRGRFHPFIA